MEFLIVFKFFVSVSDEVFNILRNSPLDLLVGQCPTISIIGGARAPAAPAESTPMLLAEVLQSLDIQSCFSENSSENCCRNTHISS